MWLHAGAREKRPRQEIAGIRGPSFGEVRGISALSLEERRVEGRALSGALLVFEERTLSLPPVSVEGLLNGIRISRGDAAQGLSTPGDRNPNGATPTRSDDGDQLLRWAIPRVPMSFEEQREIRLSSEDRGLKGVPISVKDRVHGEGLWAPELTANDGTISDDGDLTTRGAAALRVLDDLGQKIWEANGAGLR